MSISNCCFLICIEISQDAGQVIWYSHLVKNFPEFVLVHIVKGFGIVNKAEVDVFLEFSCFFDDPTDVGNLISGSSLPFLNPAWTSGSARFMYCWSLAWRILSIALLACEMSAIHPYIYFYIYIVYIYAYLQCRRPGFNPWVGNIPWKREWLPLQCSCMENPMDIGTWWATVPGVTKSQTQVNNIFI